MTTCFLCLMAALMTLTWYVYGIKEITRSCSETAFSSASSSVTSRAIALVFLTPLMNFWAFSWVLEATVILFSGRLARYDSVG